MITEGSRSPWGTIDSVQRLGRDVAYVGTPTHGGLYMGPSAAKAIPQQVAATFIESPRWPEEDLEATIALAFLQDAGQAATDGKPGSISDPHHIVAQAISIATKYDRYAIAVPLLEGVRSNLSSRLPLDL